MSHLAASVTPKRDVSNYLAGLVAIEKLAPSGELVARVLGGVMIGAGVVKWASASLP
jgi:predicted metal-binding membrane protein